MADLNFEEHCPCGGSMKVSGYTNEVRAQVQVWQHTHNRHAQAIAKAVAENTAHPVHWWPYHSAIGGNAAYIPETPSAEAKEKGRPASS